MTNNDHKNKENDERNDKNNNYRRKITAIIVVHWNQATFKLSIS